MNRSSISVPSLLLALLAMPSVGQETPTITDEVKVEERSLLVHVASGQPLTPEAARLQIGGVDQIVTRVEDVDLRQTPWNLLIWVDRSFVSPSDLATAAAALGQRSGALCDLGFVTLVEAAPSPRTVVSATRSATVLEKALSDMARGGRVQARQTSPWRFPGEEVAREGMVKLPEILSTWRSNGPQALLYLGGESGASGEDLRSLAEDAPGEETPWAAAVRSLSQRLAVDSWTVVGIVLRPTAADRAPSPDPVEQLREQGTGETRFFVDLLHVVSARGSKAKIQNAAALEPHLLPRIAPLVTVVRQSGGVMISQDAQIDLALEELRKTRRLWYRLTDLALQGIQPLELGLQSADGALVRAPQWVDLGSSN